MLFIEHQQDFNEEDLNDCGLRKTKYSEKLYMKNKLEQNLETMERLSLSPTESPEDRTRNDFCTAKSKEAPVKQKCPSSPRPSRKEKSFVDQKPPSRAASVEHKTDITSSPRKRVNSKIEDSKNSTWNGRSKATRPSLNAETYVSPFARNSTGIFLLQNLKLKRGI